MYTVKVVGVFRERAWNLNTHAQRRRRVVGLRHTQREYDTVHGRQRRKLVLTYDHLSLLHHRRAYSAIQGRRLAFGCTGDFCSLFRDAQQSSGTVSMDDWPAEGPTQMPRTSL